MKKAMGFILGAVLTVSSIGTVMGASAAETEQAFRQLFENEIGMPRAAEIALQDANLAADQAEFCKKVNEYSDGRCIYDLHFITRGNTKYEYEVDVFTGDILQREQEPWEADDDMEYRGLEAAGQDFFMTEAGKNVAACEEAYQAALKDAGLKETDVTVYKYGVSYDDGKVVLDTGFIIPGQMEYDYDIELGSLMIADKDREPWDAEKDAEYKNLLTPLPPADAAAASAPAQESTGGLDPTQIALSDAGFTEADVTRLKSEKEFDDGVEKYDVSFYGPDGRKYDYEIRVSDGAIIDKEAEYDD